MQYSVQKKLIKNNKAQKKSAGADFFCALLFENTEIKHGIWMY